jgi:glycosyltransferase involved in cell wall biosynthesis
MSGIAVLIPAFEEEKTLPAVLTSLQQAMRQGIVAHALVVDDGSSDRTREVVHAHGIEALRLPKNSGKAYAFALGVQRLAARKPDYLVTLDADLAPFTPDNIQRLVQPLRDHPKLKMTVGEVYNKKGLLEYENQLLSGARAFDFRALAPLLRRTPRWMTALGIGIKNGRLFQRFRVGYGLEIALNHLLSPTPELDAWEREGRLVGTRFMTTRRMGVDSQRVQTEILYISALLHKRRTLGNQLRSILSEKSAPATRTEWQARIANARAAHDRQKSELWHPFRHPRTQPKRRAR